MFACGNQDTKGSLLRSTSARVGKGDACNVLLTVSGGRVEHNVQFLEF